MSVALDDFKRALLNTHGRLSETIRTLMDQTMEMGERMESLKRDLVDTAEWKLTERCKDCNKWRKDLE